MTGRTLFTAADAREGRGLMVLAGTSVELPKNCAVTELIIAIPDLYHPLMTTWPPDLAEQFVSFVREWCERNKRRPIAVTTTTRREPGGPNAIVILHHVPDDTIAAQASPAPATKPPAAAETSADTRGGRMPAAAAISCNDCGA